MTNQRHTELESTETGSPLNRLLLDFGCDYERQVMAELHRRGHNLIRPSHTAVFSNLAAGAVRVSELAERAQVTQQAMGKMLKQLERIGYVIRDIDGDDRRARKIRPTQRGLELMRDINQAVGQVRAYYVGTIGEEALGELEQLLNDCMRKIHSRGRE